MKNDLPQAIVQSIASAEKHAAKAPKADQILNSYAEAFEACYQGKSIAFKKAKGNTYFVLINGDKGDKSYSVDELAEATLGFLR